MKSALDIENINFVIGMALEAGTITQERAGELGEMTNKKKIAWFEKLTAEEREAIIL